MDCGNCGAGNRDGARFCIACGEALALRCASCGADLPPTAKFCDSCGAPVALQLVEEREAVATRRTVTVLFSDLTGSTALGERMDPESVRALMAPVYAAMRREVESRGGSVAKFVGDGVMALFGIPEMHEDDAARAVDAAVAMQQAIDRLSADMPVALSLKVGVNTGEVVTGAGDEDIVGDCVNVASRLEGASAPGEVLVGEETWRLSRSNATYEPVAPLTLKGKSQPVPAYRLVSLERTQEAGTATFVGRDAELRRLRASFDETVNAQESRLVSIIGSPGLGKTRLTRELGNALGEVALVVETRCDAAGTATFAPVAESLRLAAGIGESASREEILEAIKALIPDDESRDRIAQRAAALLGAGEPGSTEETFWAIRRIIESAAHVRPLVLVLDDMHWAEPLLLDLVEHLAQWIRTAPVMLVVTGRPELREIRPSLTDGAISLEGLDGAATEQLARGLLGSDRVPRELLARLPASTEGNPLFVREFVRMLVDDGVLRRSGDEWISTVDVDAIEVPPTIQSLLAARVERLTQHERTVLEIASVVGKEFYRGAVNELAPETVRVGLESHLESLRRKELVEPVGTYWIDEPVFRFHHALIQDAAYRRLLKESRAEMHERVAAWLEMKTEGLLGEHDELIGYHLEQAHESRRQLGVMNDHVRVLGERAAALLASAARRALDLDDLPAAASLSGRALERLEEGHGDRAEILLVRCEALLAMGDVSRATPAVYELADIAGSPRLHAWADCFSGELANLTDPTRLRETEKRVSVAAKELAELGDAAGAAKAHTVRSTALAGLGQVGECESALDDALTAAREAGDRRRVTDVLGRAPTAALWGPSPVSRAGGRCLDIVRLLRITTGSPAVEATSLRCQAVLEAFRGRADAARRMLRKARRDLEELGLEYGIHETEMFAGIVELAAGDPAAAEPHLRAAHEGLLAMRVDVHAARAAALLARAHLAMGEEDEADRYADESERLGGDDLKTAISWRAVRAQILSRRGRFDEARRLAESAVEIAARTDALIDHANACAALAVVCRDAGDVDAATRASEQARSLYERKGATAFMDTTAGPVAGPSHVSSEKTPDAVRPNECTRVVGSVIAAFAARDWDLYRSLFVEDVVIEERRPYFRGSPIIGPDAVVEMTKAMADLGTTWVDPEHLATRGERLAMSLTVFAGPVVGAGRFDTEMLVVWEIGNDGLVSRVITFAPDDRDSALAELESRFSALESAEARGLSNSCTRVADRFALHLAVQDSAAIAGSFGDDVTWIDRRAGFRTTLVGRQAVLENFEAVIAIGVTQVDNTVLATRGDRLALLNQRMRGGAGSFDAEFIGVSQVDVTGRFMWNCIYDVDDMDTALADLDERYTAGEGAEFLPIVSAMRRATVGISSGDPDWPQILSEDFVQIDHRPAYFGEMSGSEFAESVLAIRSLVPDLRVYVQSFVALGEDVALTAVITTGTSEDGGSVEQVWYGVGVVREGLITRIERYAPEDLDKARTRFDELTKPLVEPLQNLATRGATVAVDAVLRQDWDALDAALADNYIWIDHRAGFHATADKRVAIENFKVISAVGVARVDVLPVALRGERLALTRQVFSTADGAAAEVLTVSESDDKGLLLASIVYDAEAFDAAMADLERRFIADQEAHGRPDELTPATGLGPPENACTRVTKDSVTALFARDWERLASLMRDDYRWVDQRSGLQTSIGKADALKNYQAMGELDITRIEYDVIATRGELLALQRELFVGGPDSSVEVEALVVSAIDTEGRGVIDVVFDPSDLDGAVAELDERFAAGEGAELAGSLRALIEFSRAVARDDADGMAAFLADDIVVVDHRPASHAEFTGNGAFIEWTRSILEFVSDAHTYIESFVAYKPNACVAQVVNVGTTVSGGEFNISYCAVALMKDGRCVRMERYPREAVDEALARYAELAGDAPPELAGDHHPSVFDNLCVRATRAFVADFEDAGPEELGSHIAEDAIAIDHRLGLKSELAGREAVVGNFSALKQLGVKRVDLRVLATRGERLALFELLLRGDERTDFDGVVLGVIQLDADGRMASAEVWDPGDEDSAFAQLDERYLAGEGRSFPWFRSAFDHVQAYNTRDWERMRATATDDFVWLDHRPASTGLREGIDALIEVYRGLIELVPDARMRVPELRVADERGIVGPLIVSGTTPEGAAVEVANESVVFFRDGLLQRVEVFPAEIAGSALTRLDGLVADASTESAFDNECLRGMRRGVECFERRDWEGLAATYAPDAVLDDRRKGVRDVRQDRASVMGTMRSMAELGVERILTERLALRGDRLALSRMTFTGAADAVSFETEVLALYELDDHQLVGRSIVFDAEDLDAAFAELDERFVVGEGARYAAQVRLAIRNIAAVNRGDWDGYRATLADDLVFVDHRLASAESSHGADRRVEEFRTLVELMSSYRLDVVALPALGAKHALGVLEVRGETADGAAVEIGFCLLVTLGDGVFTHLEAFALNDLDRALLRFEELDRPGEAATSPAAFVMERYEQAFGRQAAPAATTGELANACSAIFDKVLDHFRRRDWDALGSLYAPTFTAEDRRPGLRNVASGREGSVEGWQAAAEVGATRAFSTVVATRGDRLALTAVEFGADDNSFSTRVLFLNELDEAGLIVRALLLDPDDHDGAETALTERFVLGEGAQDASELALQNECTRVYARLMDSAVAGHWDATESLIAADVVVEDRRQGVGWRTEGRVAAVENMRIANSLSWPRRDVLAIRGDRTALYRLRWTHPNGFDVDLLSTMEINDGGLLSRAVAFDVADADAAYWDLEERYFTGDGARNEWAWRIMADGLDAYAKRDWDRFAAAFAEDVVFIDRRPASLGRIEGRENCVASIRALVEVAPDLTLRARALLAIGDGCLVADMAATGTNLEGGDVELTTLFVVRVVDGLVTELDSVPTDQRQLALSRFDEMLTAQRTIPHVLENAATRTEQRTIDAALASDWDAFADTRAPGFVGVDRRRGLGNETEGRDASVEHAKAVESIGVSSVTFTTTAVRGERLALIRETFTGDHDAFYTENLQVIEVDDEERVVWNSSFDVDDLDAAYAELDERYALGEAAESAAVVRTWAQFRHDANAREWAAARTLLTDDFVLVDSRPASLGTLTADEWIESMRVQTELAPDMRAEFVRYHALAPAACVVENVLRATSHEESAVEITNLLVTAFHGDRIARIDMFPVEQVGEALVRLDELTKRDDTAPRTPANACTWAIEERARIFEARDWDALADLYAPGIFGESRRRGLRQVVEGRVAMIRSTKAIADVGTTRTTATVIATRGDRLALCRVVFAGEGDFEVEILEVDEVDGDGRLVATISLDVDDVEAAFAELDERYLVGEGAPVGGCWRVIARAVAAFNARDWDVWAASASEDFAYLDHRPMKFGEIEGRADNVLMDQTLVDVIPDLRMRVIRIEGITQNGCFVLGRSTGTNSGGGPVELTSYVVVQIANGEIKRMDEYDLDSRDAAHACFRELASDELPARLENVATANVRQGVPHLVHGRWDGVRALLAPDTRLEDRRVGFGLVCEGIEENITAMKAIRDIGVTEIDVTPVATRGDRLVLTAMGFRSSSIDYEARVLSLVEVDADGLCVRSMSFDEDDFDAAFAELDERYAAGEGSAYPVWGVLMDTLPRTAEWDLTRALARCSEDFVMVDHRAVSIGRVEGREKWAEVVGQLHDLIPDLRIRVIEICGISPTTIVFRRLRTGTNEEGGHTEVSSYQVAVASDGILRRIEEFPIEDRAAALARFDELSAHSDSAD